MRKTMQIFRSWILAACWVAVLALAARAEDSVAAPASTASSEPAVTAKAGEEQTSVVAAPAAEMSSAEAPAPVAAAKAEAHEAAPAVSSAPAAPPAPSAPIVESTKTARPDGGTLRVKVIPVRDVIAKPVLYVIRRGLKEAQAEGMRAVVLDMETPGGELGVTLDIMEALDKFDGETLVYVNKEAISAGAIISSVADEIHFAPSSVIGAAAAVSGGGEEIAATMRQKINSYLNAKVRSFSSGKGYRAEVIRAMMDADYEFKIGETVIKPKGELLSLTAEEAAKSYGDPASALLSSGTHESLDDLLASKYGKGGYEVVRMEVSWSEELASWLTSISPLLMGLGLLCVFIEFKTPGFGIFGIAGGVMLALVFFGHYAAGLSGHEAAIVFGIGVALVAVELFLMPGTLVAGILGVLLMLGALVWSMLDVWPGEMPELGGDVLFRPLLNLFAAIGVAVIGALALAKFLPRGWFWDKMILQAAVAGDAGTPEEGMGGVGAATEAPGVVGDSLLGERGRTVSVMRPMGEVEIAGRRHEARAADGALERGEPVRVTGRTGRVLIVERDGA
jgi:membrane-bound serine protease (ClpP class)